MGNSKSCAGGKPINEFPAGSVSDYKDNSMREVLVNDGQKVIVAKHDGKFYGFGGQCTHYGGPLAKGILHNGTIRCPWHGACFNIKTGDIEDFPGLDCLPVFKVTTRDDNVIIHCEAEYKERRMHAYCKQKQKKPVFVIVGGGIAALTCAETLRANKFEGKIIMFTKEAHLPYDRTLLSKTPGMSIDALKIREFEFFKELDIHFMSATPVVSIDFPQHEIKIHGSDDAIGYDKLLIATGMIPRDLTADGIPGSDLKNIVTLGTVEDSQRIHKETVGKTVVIIAATFMALELASHIREHAKKVIILAKSESPMSYTFGTTTSKALLDYLLQHSTNVEFHGPHEFGSFNGNADGEVTQAVSQAGEVFDCDYVIVAMWAVPNTEIVKDTSMKLCSKSGAILVDKTMETSIAGIYAAGDVASFPFDICSTGEAPVAAWNVAQEHGKCAALSMMGKPCTISNLIPYYWGNFFGINFRSSGYVHGCDAIEVYGDPTVMHFCTLYRHKKKLIGCVTAGCDPIAAAVESDLKERKFHEESCPPYVSAKFPKPPHAEKLQA